MDKKLITEKLEKAFSFRKLKWSNNNFHARIRYADDMIIVENYAEDRNTNDIKEHFTVADIDNIEVVEYMQRLFMRGYGETYLAHESRKSYWEITNCTFDDKLEDIIPTDDIKLRFVYGENDEKDIVLNLNKEQYYDLVDLIKNINI